jgi:hypothetical protein
VAPASATGTSQEAQHPSLKLIGKIWSYSAPIIEINRIDLVLFSILFSVRNKTSGRYFAANHKAGTIEVVAVVSLVSPLHNTLVNFIAL